MVLQPETTKPPQMCGNAIGYSQTNLKHRALSMLSQDAERMIVKTSAPAV